MALVDKINTVTGWDKIVFVGDYIDRGDNSKGVIDYIMQLQTEHGDKVVALKGNHEDMCLHAHEKYEHNDSRFGDAFYYNGGSDTITSFGGKIPEEYLEWMLSLPVMHEDDNCYYVHAGFEPCVEPEDQDDYQMLWIREEFLSSMDEWDKRIVHGHTPRQHACIDNTRISIDTGCVYGHTLTAVCVQTHIFIQQDNIED